MFVQIIVYILPFTSLFVTYFAIPKLFYLQRNIDFQMFQGASHEKSVPIFGGVAIFSGILLSCFWGTFDDIQ